MKILLEGTQALRQHRGWGRYNLEVIRALSSCVPDNEYIVFYNRFGLDDRWFRAAIARENVRAFALDYSAEQYLAIEGDFDHSFIDRHFPDVDIYHSVTEFPMFTRRAKLVTMIHEVTALIHPANFSEHFLREFERYIDYNVEKADILLTGSENTRTELLALRPVPPDRVRSVHLGVNETFLAPAGDPALALPGSYLLYVGSVLDLNKRFSLLSGAFAGMDSDIHLLVVTNELDAEDLRARFGLPQDLAERVLVMGDLDDGQLAEIYRRAALLVFPACHEGFGLPLIEAMACGCPVLYADNSSLREIGEGIGESFTGGDAAELAGRIASCLASYPEGTIARARARVQAEYRWSITAGKYGEIYRELAG